jgi:hypothetical protein
MWEKKIWLISLACLWLGLGWANPARAHKLLISAVPEGGGLKVQVFFPDGTPAQEVPVKVTPADGRPALTGKTDNLGVCQIAGVAPGQYRVEAGDPLGHRAETRVTVPGAPVAGPIPAATGATASPPPRGEPIPWANLLAGLGFIFGLSAFVMVLRLRAEVRKYASRD